MCNLYSITMNQEAIRALFRAINRYVGNLAPMPGVFPDYPAPVIRNSGGERESRSVLRRARHGCKRCNRSLSAANTCEQNADKVPEENHPQGNARVGPHPAHRLLRRLQVRALCRDRRRSLGR